MRSSRRRSVCLLAAVAIVALGFPALLAQGHEDASIDSFWSDAGAAIDGVASPGEWADAPSYDLGAIPGNAVAAFMRIKNNGTLLWFAYDVVGDTTEDPNDTASFAFDTGHDGVGTAGREDQFVHGYYNATHLVYDGAYWVVHDGPFDTSLPNHAGLAASQGFGPSDLAATPHRIFEFQVPLALLGASPGDTLGLFGGSLPAPGVVDISSYRYSTWPAFVTGPIPLGEYGDLTLGSPLAAAAGVVVTPSVATVSGDPGSSVRYDLFIRNTGTAGGDTFDLSVASPWTVALYDASGASALIDTDGDGDPDTGNITAGGLVQIVVEVSIPADAAGCSTSTVTATSSRDVTVSDSSNLTACTVAAHFEPPHTDFGVDTDSPPNGFFDFVRLDVNVNVSASGSYSVAALLLDANGTVGIDFQGTTLTVSPGLRVVTFQFDARRIVAVGIPGPYRVELFLSEASGARIDNDTHMTLPYALDEFDPPNAQFNPPHSDFGRDTDSPPNGLYDELVISVSIRVNAAGTYRVTGYLYDVLGRFVLPTERIQSLGVGRASVELVYPGFAINAARADGPYMVELLLVEHLTFEILGESVYVTGPYAASQFDGPPILLAAPHDDVAVDSDTPPDGLYDWLVVRASVVANEPGAYILFGSLYSDRFIFIANTFAIANLNVGSHTVELRFPGPYIAQVGADGPYLAELFVADWPSSNYSDYDLHMTAPYEARTFAPASGALGSTHSDVGIDATTPPDGMFDWIAIDVAVDVSRAGAFEVQVNLYGDRLDWITSGDAGTSLPLGRSVVRVLLDARAARASGFPGPYIAEITLNDRNGVDIAYGFHLTRSYALTSLQPTDTIRPSSLASVAGGYWRNARAFRVDFAAADPSPSGMLAGVTLYYRYSANNVTWGQWKAYATQTASATSATGSFAFDAPDGEGYYEFAAVAADRAGNEEPAPTAAESRVAVFVPVRIELTPPSVSMSEGQVQQFQVSVRAAAGEPAPTERAMTISLRATSPTGEFRAAGSSTSITEVVIPMGSSSVSVDFVDSGAGTVVLVASADGVESGIAMVVVQPSGPLGAPLAQGLAGGAVVGVIAGVAVGWFLWRRARRPPPPAPPGS